MYSSADTWACPHVGFPIRTSPAQTAAHTSPELFAVYRVLRRHWTPQAFTVCPCSFSTMCSEKLSFSRYFSRYSLGNVPPVSSPAGTVAVRCCHRPGLSSTQSIQPIIPAEVSPAQAGQVPYPAWATDTSPLGSLKSGCLRRKRPDILPGRELRHVACRLLAIQFAERPESSTAWFGLSQQYRLVYPVDGVLSRYFRAWFTGHPAVGAANMEGMPLNNSIVIGNSLPGRPCKSVYPSTSLVARRSTQKCRAQL